MDKETVDKEALEEFLEKFLEETRTWNVGGFQARVVIHDVRKFINGEDTWLEGNG